MLTRTYGWIFNFKSKIITFFKKSKTSLYQVVIIACISFVRSSIEMLRIKSLNLVKSSLMKTIACATWVMISFVNYERVAFFFTPFQDPPCISKPWSTVEDARIWLLALAFSSFSFSFSANLGNWFVSFFSLATRRTWMCGSFFCHRCSSL